MILQPSFPIWFGKVDVRLGPIHSRIQEPEIATAAAIVEGTIIERITEEIRTVLPDQYPESGFRGTI
jgi:hypothetical protein